MASKHITQINPALPVTVEMAAEAMEHIKPGDTNFSHFYLPQNLDSMNGVYPDFPKGTDVYVVGDIHGDYDLMVNLLTKVAKVAKRNPDGTYDWIKPNSWLICVGDMVDRRRAGIKQKDGTFLGGSYQSPDGGTMGEGLDDIGQIQDLLNMLTLKGHLEGRNNKVIKLLGNHDILVTAPPTSTGRHDFMVNYSTKKSKDSYNNFYTGLSDKDKKLYSPNYSTYCCTELAKKILSGNTAVICNIGRWFYTHGGVINLTLDRIREECFPPGLPLGHEMLARLNNHICSLIYNFSEHAETIATAESDKCYMFIKSDDAVEDRKSPLWLRKLGSCGTKGSPVDNICRDINGALKSLKEILDPNDNSVHIVVAHCPQTQVRYENNGQVFSFSDSTPYINDSDRLIYNSPGLDVAQPNPYVYHGITYTCTNGVTPSAGGRLWRIDCAMSRAFDAEQNYNMPSVLAYKYYRSRRPQCLAIRIKSNGEYDTKVLLGKEGLDRSEYFTKKGIFNNLPISHDSKSEKQPVPESMSRQLSLPEDAIDFNILKAVSTPSQQAAGMQEIQDIIEHHDELLSVPSESFYNNNMSASSFPSVPSESFYNNNMSASSFPSVASESFSNIKSNSPPVKKASGRKTVSSPAFESIESPSPSPSPSPQPHNPGYVAKPTPNRSRKNSGNGSKSPKGARSRSKSPKGTRSRSKSPKGTRKATAFKSIANVNRVVMNTGPNNSNMGFEILNKLSPNNKRRAYLEKRRMNAAESNPLRMAGKAAKSLYNGVGSWWSGGGKK